MLTDDAFGLLDQSFIVHTPIWSTTTLRLRRNCESETSFLLRANKYEYILGFLWKETEPICGPSTTLVADNSQNKSSLPNAAAHFGMINTFYIRTRGYRAERGYEYT